MAEPADNREDQDDPLPTLGQAPIVRWLIGLNLIVYALDTALTMVFKDPQMGETIGEMGMLTYYGSFRIAQGTTGMEYWRYLSYQFLHANLLHLGMNMMALYVFGPMVEKWWGARRFLAFYLLCGACGAWLMGVFGFFPSLVNPEYASLVGASGSIFGVLVAVAMLYPKVEVKLVLPPIWVTTRKLAMIFLGLSVVAMFFDFNFGGNAAHLGGALFGYVLIRRPWSLDFFDSCAPKLEPPGKGGFEADAAADSPKTDKDQ